MFLKKLFCIRGAVCADNNEESIKNNVSQLWNCIIKENNINTKNIISVQFTITPDLDQLNPATALRLVAPKDSVSSISLFCSQEPIIKNMKNKIIRIMITTYLPSKSITKSVYLNGAETLRPDLNSLNNFGKTK